VTPALSSTLLRTQTDERLVRLAGDGHDRAFEAIVERYRRPLARYLRRMLPAPRAEDALQQTFVNAWAALSAGTEVRELRGWLYRIAHNTAAAGLQRAGYDYDELHESLQGAGAVAEDA
jgi:DNA-directed RNA polymerase specialized sigma24 family protein